MARLDRAIGINTMKRVMARSSRAMTGKRGPSISARVGMRPVVQSGENAMRLKEGKMEARGGYGQFCPVAMAAEVLCTRWTPLLVRELIAGSTRFNDLRRGVPRMSPALLSQRLKELESAGVICRTASPTEPGVFEYHLTAAGRELEPVGAGVRHLGSALGR